LSTRPAARRPTPPPADEPPHESSPTPNQSNSVQLGPRDRLIGQLYIEGDLRVGGVVEGEVEATGDVEIDDMAKVKASLSGRDVSIRGQVNGAVVARKRLIVARSGSLIGDVRVARLVIQDGASFSGKVSMGAGAAEKPMKAVEPPPAPAMPAEPEVHAVVEAPAPVAQAPAVQPPVAPPAAVKPPASRVPVARVVVPPAKPASKDGKGKAVAPKAKPKRR
jgi:cytoskeletal protein CcmA (bactofilin family)